VTTKKRPPNRQAREVEYDHKKFVSVRVAARRAGLSHTTLYQWARKGHTSNGTPIVVIQDNLTNQLLISEESIQVLLQDRFRPVAQVDAQPARKD
jgi:hypothetical protein